MIFDFDEINNLHNEDDYILKYFEDMDITQSSKDKRIDFSTKMYDIMLFVFALVKSMQESGYIDEQYIILQLTNRYFELIDDFSMQSQYIQDYVGIFARQTVDVTLEHLQDIDGYFMSNERALIIAVNEANTIFNYSDYDNAMNNGFTKKQWITEKDDKVRITHVEVDDSIVDINEPFVVGDSLLMFPKDTSLGASAEEIVNCRCSVKYLK